MKNIFKKTKTWIIKHKVITAIIVIVVIVGGYFIYKKVIVGTPPTQYVLGQVKKGTLVSSIDGTGQVSATNQIDLKPKVSAKVTSISVKSGQEVGKGAVIARLDAGDASRTVRDAEINLQSAELALDKLNKTNSPTDLKKAYDDGFNAVVETFLDFPSLINNLDKIINNGNGYLSNNSINSLGSTAIQYRETAVTSYYKAKTEHDQNLKDYRLVSRDSSTATIDEIITETYNSSQTLAQTIKDMKTLVDYVQLRDRSTTEPPQLAIDQSSLDDFTNTVSAHSTALIDSQSTIKNTRDSIGNDSLDVRSAKLTVTERQNALNDANADLGDYTIRAPFLGVIGSVAASLADDVGPSSIVATLVTKQKIAVIQLNEVDVAKISLGDKATLTFDALPDLTLTGTTEEIEDVGVLSQGVVTYNVKIAFDTQDERVKPTMSVSATIITDSKEGVLTAPNSAVKTNPRGESYVQEILGTLSNERTISTKAKPQTVIVQVGESNDTDTEIVSGLNEGEIIVIRSVSTTGTTQTSAAPTLFGGGTGGNRGAGGATGANRTIRPGN